MVVSAQSVEGLHDDPSERDRLMNAASTIVAHRLADPDPVVARGGTVRRAERSHQLDGAGPTGAGSLRIQDAYRVDPNEVRSLPAGVAFVVSAGRAAKVAVARGGQAPLAGSPDATQEILRLSGRRTRPSGDRAGTERTLLEERRRLGKPAAGDGERAPQDEALRRSGSPYAEGL